MIRINLGKDEFEKTGKGAAFLNPDLAEKLGLGNSKISLSTVIQIGVVAAFSCLPYLFSTQYRAYMESQIQLQLRTLAEKEDVLKGEIQKMSIYKTELESYEKQKQKIVERLDTVRKLLETRATPVNVMDAVGQALPKRAWLESIELTVSEKPSVSLSGTTVSNDDVSDFVDKLSESIHLTDVTLENMLSKTLDNADSRSFQITAIPKGLNAVQKPTATLPARPSPPSMNRETATSNQREERD